MSEAPFLSEIRQPNKYGTGEVANPVQKRQKPEVRRALPLAWPKAGSLTAHSSTHPLSNSLNIRDTPRYVLCTTSMYYVLCTNLGIVDTGLILKLASGASIP